jgi:plastocyanin
MSKLHDRGGRKRSRRCERWVLLAILCAPTVNANPVTVKVATSSGEPALDTIVIFDPLDSAAPDKPATAVIDQVNKRFVPRVSVVRTGTAVTLPNSDHIRHQVYSFSPAKTFSLKLYAGSPAADVVFDKPGLVVLGCNIHDTMVGFVGVADSPYFGKIGGADGILLDLPAGHYRLRIWHPNLAAVLQAPREIAVTEGPLAIPVTVQLDSSRETVAAWP